MTRKKEESEKCTREQRGNKQQGWEEKERSGIVFFCKLLNASLGIFRIYH